MASPSPATADAEAGMGISLSVGSWNCNQGLESRIADIMAWIWKYDLDILLIQDCGEIMASKWRVIQQSLEEIGFLCIVKSYAPENDAKYTEMEKNYLKERRLFRDNPAKWPMYPAGSIDAAS